MENGRSLNGARCRRSVVRRWQLAGAFIAVLPTIVIPMASRASQGIDYATMLLAGVVTAPAAVLAALAGHPILLDSPAMYIAMAAAVNAVLGILAGTVVGRRRARSQGLR